MGARPAGDARLLAATGRDRSRDVPPTAGCAPATSACSTRRAYLKLLDRKKDLVNVSGFKVFPNEVEDVAVQHPGVLEAAVIGVPDARTGQAVKLFIVKRDPALDKADLKAFLHERLAGYKRAEPSSNSRRLCPRAISARFCAKNCIDGIAPLFVAAYAPDRLSRQIYRLRMDTPP